MERNDLLLNWLFSEKKTLKQVNSEIQKIEESQEYQKKLKAIQTELLDKWLNEEHLLNNDREELSSFYDHISKSEFEDQKKLQNLKSQKSSMEFVINKLKEELKIEGEIKNRIIVDQHELKEDEKEKILHVMTNHPKLYEINTYSKMKKFFDDHDYTVILTDHEMKFYDSNKSMPSFKIDW